MPSTLGDARRVGPYEIIETLGRGAMGEVFVARDSRLSRNVAIKVISDATSDPSRRKRFIQEARSASALNHPNIVTIHDFGTSDGISYIVSELVEGESLRDVLRRGPLGLRKLLDLAIQIADALAAAHEAGIVHRDLKPENIMIAGGDRVKLLDFGLAKTLAGGGDSESTMDDNLTEPGFIVGTVAYMSPEQARGEQATIQSDQFSFGVILHEMATGHHPFKRDTPMETLIAIANFQRPPFTPGPVSFRMLVERCLAVDPGKRFANTSETIERLTKIRRDLPDDPSAKPVPVSWWRKISPRAITYALLGIALCALGVLVAARALTPSLADPQSFRFLPFSTESTFAVDPAWSPNGRTVAYSSLKSGVMQIFTRGERSPMFTQVTSSNDDCAFPSWSADGSRILYVSRHSLWSINVTGGTPELITSNVDRAAMSPDGKKTALLRDHALWIEQKRIPLPSPVEFFAFSPDSNQLAAWAGGKFWTLTSAGTKQKQHFPQLESVTGLSWVPDGRHVLISGSHLWAGDLGSGTLQKISNGTGSEQMPAVSPDGQSVALASVDDRYGLVTVDLAVGSAPHSAGAGFDEQWPAWSPLKGEYAYVTKLEGKPEIRLRSAGADWERTLATGVEFSELAFAPGGLSIAYIQHGRTWVAPLSGDSPVQLAIDDEDQHSPAWSPDGNSIAVFAMRGGKRVLEKQRVGSQSAPVVLREDQGNSMDWSPRGDWIAYAGSQPGVTLVSADGSQSKQVGTGEWLALTWTKHGSLIAGVKREKRDLVVATIDPSTGVERTLAQLGNARGVRGFSIAPDERTATVSLLSASSKLWLLRGLTGR